MPRRLRIRRRRRLRRKKFIPRTLCPAKKVIKCTAVDTFGPTFTSGALHCVKVQGNSIDDVFLNDSNNQPLGYDQWKAFYQKAKVLGCKVFAEWHNGSSGAIVCGVTPFAKTQSATALGSLDHYIECPGTKHKVFSPDVDKGIIVSKRSTKKMMKVRNIEDADFTEIDLVAETAPDDMYRFHVWTQPFDQATALTGVNLLLKVEYIVLLYDPVIPARSSETP